MRVNDELIAATGSEKSYYAFSVLMLHMLMFVKLVSHVTRSTHYTLHMLADSETPMFQFG